MTDPRLSAAVARLSCAVADLNVVLTAILLGLPERGSFWMGQAHRDLDYALAHLAVAKPH